MQRPGMRIEFDGAPDVLDRKIILSRASRDHPQKIPRRRYRWILIDNGPANPFRLGQAAGPFVFRGQIERILRSAWFEFPQRLHHLRDRRGGIARQRAPETIASSDTRANPCGRQASGNRFQMESRTQTGRPSAPAR